MNDVSKFNLLTVLVFLLYKKNTSVIQLFHVTDGLNSDYIISRCQQFCRFLNPQSAYKVPLPLM
jgi:hypothetical protein